MQHSRYPWLIGIILLSLFLFLSWKTPKTVITAIANPFFSDSPQLTIQKFWNFLDSRQIDLVEGLIRSEGTPIEGRDLVSELKKIVEEDALLKLQKVEFLDLRNSQAIIVKVTWSSSLNEAQTKMYCFDVRKTNLEWRIWGIKMFNNLS
ncbi:MAG: hypothetical protein PHV03_04100 [Desulfitobacteriaceae bacterium]|nr:hypothetical protein [Desulfitobacteriaceae bacterium]MDD4400966.1 hypothetical protein [Desulfitobacteriaceae bacterium]